MRKLLLILAVVAIPTTLAARTPSPRKLSALLTGTLSATGMNAARTLTVTNDQLEGFDWLIVELTLYDPDDSTTAISISCPGMYTKTSPAKNIPTCRYDTTNTRWNCEAAPWYWVPSDETTSDYKTNTLQLRITGARNVTCTITPTGGDATDTLATVTSATVD